ncbi:phenylalanine--tRNA ligase beta subunit [Striga asiatica]|uniref:Phenylalanine--tRNA ligase beta subunit n=1 Tax=Striga asiatica TaxID=4170 RepID=A0A5A7P0A7_STRAF|nr:phenylalanine--tRNA ligase beta subunit [Striga asiatica]
MALSFTRWLWLGGREKEKVSNGSVMNSINSKGDWGVGLRGEPESLKFFPVKNSASRVKRKWKSREERGRRVDKEYDVVLVPSDGICLSGSESDDSDWSIGWLEPHASNFESDADEDDSFAVLVPCYRHDFREVNEVDEESKGNPFLNAVKNFPIIYSADGTKYMEQWLSSLQNF